MAPRIPKPKSGADGWGDASPTALEKLRVAGFCRGDIFAQRYRVESIIGQGAMGKIVGAVDLTTDRRIALKLLHAHRAGEGELVARFLQEAEILRNLGHPGIVRILDSGRAEDGAPYLVMELLRGGTLGERLRADGTLWPREVLPLLVAIADALDAAHQVGIVHRDVKPDNIFLPDDGSYPVKILDFGLSRLRRSHSAGGGLTQQGAILGTPRYMAPEQIRSARDVTIAVDIYGLGVVVHEALTGASPFPASAPAQLLGCIMEGRVLRLEDERQGLPPGLGEVIRRAMAVDPRQRYVSVGAFAEAFAEALGVPSGRSQLSEHELSEFFNLTATQDVPLDPDGFEDGRPPSERPSSPVPSFSPPFPTPSGMVFPLFGQSIHQASQEKRASQQNQLPASTPQGAVNSALGAQPAFTPPTGMPRNTPAAPQAVPPQGFPTQAAPAQGFPPQGLPTQAAPSQGFPTQAAPAAGFPPQGVSTQGLPSQGFSSQAVSPQSKTSGRRSLWKFLLALMLVVMLSSALGLGLRRCTAGAAEASPGNTDAATDHAGS